MTSEQALFYYTYKRIVRQLDDIVAETIKKDIGYIDAMDMLNDIENVVKDYESMKEGDHTV